MVEINTSVISTIFENIYSLCKDRRVGTVDESVRLAFGMLGFRISATTDLSLKKYIERRWWGGGGGGRSSKHWFA